MSWLIASLLMGVAEPTCGPNDLAACVRWMEVRGNAAKVDLDDSAVIGQWTEGPGLSGSELYLFPDHTFIHTQWTDLFPEVINDKGTWTLAQGALTLRPDEDIKWKVRSDRRYVALRQVGESSNLLLGMERALSYFRYKIGENAKDGPRYLRLASRTRLATWPNAEAAAVKSALMKRCWRPEEIGK